MICRLVAILFLVIFAESAMAKYNICTVTINSPEETQTFKQHLSQKDFNFTELTEFCGEDPDCEDRWIDMACEQNIQCDVLLISGHFGGTFFGDKGMNLSLDKMEQMSCRAGCEGIFNRPKEVYLFGCNTLASKDVDHRTPEEYRQVLVNDGFDSTDAERIAQARYGALGASFRERMQRVFSQVQSLYGFDSVGPSGKTVKPFLDRYFKKVGNYAEHLEKYEVEEAVDLINQSNKIFNKDFSNTLLAEILRDTAFTQCEGISPDDPSYKLKKDLCALYDPGKSIEEKVHLVEKMLSGENSLVFFSAISSYVENDNRSTEIEQLSQALKKMKDNPHVMANLKAASTAFEKYPTLKIDLLRLQFNIGMMDKDEFLREVKRTVSPGLKRLAREDLDLLCSLKDPQSEKPLVKVELSDFDLSKVNAHPNAYAEATFCISTDDSKVTKKLLEVFPKLKLDYHNGMLWNLAQLPGHDVEVIALAKKAAKKQSTQLGAYRALVSKGSVEERLQAIKDLLKLKVNGDDPVWTLHGIDYSQLKKDEEIALLAAHRLSHDAPVMELTEIIVSNLDSKSKSWGRVIEVYERSNADSWVLAQELAVSPVDHPEVVKWCLKQAVGTGSNPRAVAALSQMTLSAQQREDLFQKIQGDPQAPQAASARGILRAQKNVVYSEAERLLLKGEVQFAKCTKSEQGGYSCNYGIENLNQ